jgi:hypothetical protein
MPNLNGAGPQGNGKLSGRGLGNCENSSQDSRFAGRQGKPRRNRFLLAEIESLKQSVEEIKAKLNSNN